MRRFRCDRSSAAGPRASAETGVLTRRLPQTARQRGPDHQSSSDTSKAKFSSSLIISFQNACQIVRTTLPKGGLNEVMQSIRRFGQRKGLSDDRPDRAGLKERETTFQASVRAICVVKYATGIP